MAAVIWGQGYVGKWQHKPNCSITILMYKNAVWEYDTDEISLAVRGNCSPELKYLCTFSVCTLKTIWFYGFSGLHSNQNTADTGPESEKAHLRIQQMTTLSSNVLQLDNTEVVDNSDLELVAIGHLAKSCNSSNQFFIICRFKLVSTYSWISATDAVWCTIMHFSCGRPIIKRIGGKLGSSYGSAPWLTKRCHIRG